MRTLQMITVSDDYLPLAGTGKNTIRQYSTKYQALAVGEQLVMHHTDNPQTIGATAATELLQVSAIAISNLDRLIEHHGVRNHGIRIPSFGADYSDAKVKLKEHILSLYPVPDGEQRNPGDLYCAIYF